MFTVVLALLSFRTSLTFWSAGTSITCFPIAGFRHAASSADDLVCLGLVSSRFWLLYTLSWQGLEEVQGAYLARRPPIWHVLFLSCLFMFLFIASQTIEWVLSTSLPFHSRTEDGTRSITWLGWYNQYWATAAAQYSEYFGEVYCWILNAE